MFVSTCLVYKGRADLLLYCWFSLLIRGGPHMTAEVAVLNEQAVALATDSAVSVGSGKIYTSANKLFTLSKYSPVGIMIFNNARHMSIPLETIIKEFRTELGTTRYNSLPEYTKALEGFLRDQNNYLFDPQNRHRGIAEYLVHVGGS